MSALDDSASDSSSESSPLQSALSALQSPGQSPEGRAWASDVLKKGVDTSGENSILQDFAADANEARTALRQARQRLSEQRLDPRILGYNFAAAMMSPSRYGIQDQWSKAASAMGDFAKQNQAFEQQKNQEDLSLAEQLSGVDKQSLNARLALQELKERTQGQSINTALRVLAQPGAGKAEFKQLESPGGKKQNAWVDPVAHTVTPVGAPFDKGAAGDLSPESLQNAYNTFKTTGSFGVFEPKGMGAAAARMQLINAVSKMASDNGDDVVQSALAGQAFKARQQTEKTFMPGGKYGDALVSTNRFIAHLGDYADLTNALHNGDIQAVNFAKNKIKTWFGGADPTNADAVAPILGDELTKALIPGGGGEREREAFASKFSAAVKSPEQMAGVARDYINFVRDQVGGTEFAYKNALGRDDFRGRFLTPRTREAFGYDHPPNALTTEQRAALIEAIRAKQTAPTGGTEKAP